MAVYNGRMIKTKKHRQSKKEIEILLRNFQDELFGFSEKFNASNKRICMEIYFYDSMYWTKNKKKMNEKTVDTSNIIKSIEDSVFKAMGLNDSFNRKIIAESIPSDKDKVIINLSLINHAVMNEVCF
jgi:Holliday junction resolvase RusA-like endonuclease